MKVKGYINLIILIILIILGAEAKTKVDKKASSLTP